MDLKLAYQALDPGHPLEPASPFYVARPDNPTSLIITELELSAIPRKYLLTGHRGGGKSTELRRIASAREATHMVVSLDVGPIVAGQQGFAPLAEFIGSAVTKGRRVEGATPQQYLEVLHRIVSKTGKRPLVLLDGVDKREGPDVLRVIDELGKLRDWPIDIVCTVPLAITLEQDFGRILPSFDGWYFLPGISVASRDGARIEEGWVLCRNILDRRARGALSDEAIGILVEQGAGIHRELLRLAQKACLLAAVSGHPRAEREHAHRAIAEVRNEYSIRLRSEDHALLRQVASSGRVSGDPELLRLVRDQFVVAYRNGHTWFAVHPMVLPLIDHGFEAASG